jgi:hypothetical protein
MKNQASKLPDIKKPKKMRKTSSNGLREFSFASSKTTKNAQKLPLTGNAFSNYLPKTCFLVFLFSSPTPLLSGIIPQKKCLSIEKKVFFDGGGLP